MPAAKMAVENGLFGKQHKLVPLKSIRVAWLLPRCINVPRFQHCQAWQLLVRFPLGQNHPEKRKGGKTQTNTRERLHPAPLHKRLRRFAWTVRLHVPSSGSWEMTTSVMQPKGLPKDERPPPQKKRKEKGGRSPL